MHQTEIHLATHITHRPSWIYESSIGSSLNRSYMNFTAFLSYLELHLGLTVPEINPRLRQIAYQHALEQFKDDTFYQKSFENDPIHVSEEILNWRDELILSGWDHTLPNQKGRLKVLADVEAIFLEQAQNYPGISDRWRIVHVSLKNSIPAIGNILLYDNIAYLHPLFKEVILLLGDQVKKVEINANGVEGSNLNWIQSLLLNEHKAFERKDDSSFLIADFADSVLLAESISALKAKGYNPLIIGADSTLVEYSLKSVHYPGITSKMNNAHTAIIQLFKLASTALISPLNIDNLFSLLQSRPNPIPFELRHRLENALSAKPGINNEKWNSAIEEARTTDAKGVEESLKSYLTFAPINKDVIPLENIVKTYSALSSWASMNATLNEDNSKREQFAYLSSLCSDLLAIIEDKMNKGLQGLNSFELSKIIESLYTSSKFNVGEHQVGGLHSVSHSGNVVFPVNSSLWIDFDGAIQSNHSLKWSTEDEINYLIDNGIEIYTIPNQIKLEFEALKRSILCSTQKCVLVRCLSKNAESTSCHPLEAYLASLIKQNTGAKHSLDAFKRTIKHPRDLHSLFGYEVDLMSINSRDLPAGGQDYFTFDKSLAFKRLQESSSSLEKLIQHPFSWLVHYNASLKDMGAYSIPEISTLQGNVAHAALQFLILASFNHNGLISMPDSATIEATLEEFIQKEAAIFLSLENRFLREEFKRKFLISSEALLRFLHLNKLHSPQCEVPFGFENNESQPLINGETKVVGYIDLLLKDQDGNKVIIDLKWSDKKKRYVEKVEEGSNIQLALYNLAQGGNCRTAYYLMAKPMLITRHSFISVQGIEMNKCDVPHSSFENNVVCMLSNSFAFRMNELEGGRAELGYDEDQELNDLDYVIHSIDNPETLIPLSIYNEAKSSDRFSGLELFYGLIR